MGFILYYAVLALISAVIGIAIWMNSYDEFDTKLGIAIFFTAMLWPLQILVAVCAIAWAMIGDLRKR